MTTSLPDTFQQPFAKEDYARRVCQIKTMEGFENLHTLVKHARQPIGQTRKDLYLTWYRAARWCDLGRVASFSLAHTMAVKAKLDIPLPSTLATLGSQHWADAIYGAVRGE